MKPIVVIIYHKNHTRYPKKWIDDFVTSIKNQRVIEYDVLELNYGGEKDQIYEGSKFFFRNLPNHAEAHNWCCKKAVKMGADVVFNTNIDDFYHYERLLRQMEAMERGIDICSCNMTQINGDNEVLREDIRFSDMPILEHAQRGHNVLAHPGCAYSKNFIQNSELLQPTEGMKNGTEKWTDDFDLWKRSYGKFKFEIVPYTLLYYRIWGGNTSTKQPT